MLKLLSAGAINRGLRALLKDSDIGDTALKLATAPRIAELFQSGEVDADIVIAPHHTLQKLAADGKVSGDMIRIGEVGVGVMVQPGADLPDISTVDAFEQALLRAGVIVHNRATTGIYVGDMLRGLDIHDRIAGRIIVVEDAPAVVGRITGGEELSIGFTGTTEIMHQQDEGHVRYAGPLPAKLQRATDYWAAMTASSDRADAEAFMRLLATSRAREIFRRSGVDF